jgi:hypothetical protein
VSFNGINSNSSTGTLSRRGLSVLRNRTWFPIVCGTLWLATAAVCLAMLWRAENTPGIRMPVPAHWPLASHIPAAPGIATLLMFAHPRCPCTRASVGELEKLIAQCNGRVRAHVIFYKPPGAPDNWAHTDLWKSAAAIPGVEVQCDKQGSEAALFGARTSGFIVLYDQFGNLRFSGGITSERGHSGDNEGRSAVVAILDGQLPRRIATPVFGCSFSRPGSILLKGTATCTR